MANIGDIVIVNGLVCKVTAISEDETPLYTVQPLRKTETELKKTVDSAQSQYFLVPSDGDPITGLHIEALGKVSSTTAKAKAIADGYVRVAFNMSDGVSFTGSYYQVIEKGAKATQPVAPTRDHYTFGGWYHDTGHSNVVNFGSDTFDDDTTLYDKWTPVSYTVTFEAGGDLTDPDAQIITYGDLVTVPVTPINPGYLLTYWSLDVDGEEPFDFTTDIIEEDTILYAQWAEAVTVTFESNDGSEVDAQVILKGGLATKPNDPTLDDNTFVGWFTDNNTFDNEFDFATTIIDDDITLYAKWEAV
jgi:uncharacterized repeat protein (TIGR02543 family)